MQRVQLHIPTELTRVVATLSPDAKANLLKYALLLQAAEAPMQQPAAVIPLRAAPTSG